jgi:hypothetical protein
MKKTSRTFHLYRYQIVPTIGEHQLNLFSSEIEISSIEELISKKNEIFANVIQKQREFYHPRAELTHKLYQDDGFIVLKIGANRSLIRITKEFKEEELDNWPSVYVVINNDPNVQMMAVELELEAFYRTSTVVHILTTNLNKVLNRYKLTLQILPTFIKSEFWNIVHSYENRITKAQFFMVAPNLANISKNLELDLGEIKSRTNSIKTNMSLQAANGEGLTLSEDDSFTNSLVHYASEGGGTVHLKVRGVRKLIKTEDSIRSTEIDEIFFTGENVSAELIEQIRKMLE